MHVDSTRVIVETDESLNGINVLLAGSNEVLEGGLAAGVPKFAWKLAVLKGCRDGGLELEGWS